jgi:hypothetical protein
MRVIEKSVLRSFSLPSRLDFFEFSYLLADNIINIIGFSSNSDKILYSVDHYRYYLSLRC